MHRDATSISAGNLGFENGLYIGLGSSQQTSFPDGSTVEDVFRNNSLVIESRHYAAGWSESTTFYANGARRSYYHNDGQGNSTTNYFDVNGGVTGDNYVRADGSHGTDIFKTDGSSNGEKYSADRTYSKYVNDGLGNIVTTFFNADGNLTRTFVEVDDSSGNKLSDSWTNADGSYGSDIFNADGSSNGTTHNTDGSYSSYTSFSSPSTNQPETDITYFNAQGIKVKYAAISADGSSTTDIFNADGSRETIRIYAGGYGSTDTIYAADGSGSYKQTSIYYNGVAGYDNFTITDAQGSYQEEYGDTSGYSGTYNYNAVAGTAGGTDHYSDGSSDIYRNDSNGDYHEQDYDALGRETRNYFYRNSDGYYSRDYFNADGTRNGDSHNPDGRYSQYAYDGHGTTNTQYFDANGALLKYDVGTNDGQGNIITNIFDAIGNKIGDSWVHADGTTGSHTFNPDGSVEAKITYTYDDGSTYATDTVNNPDGSYQQSWTQSNGSHGATNYNALTGEVIGSNATAGAGYSYTYDNTRLAGGSTESKVSYTYDDGSTYSTDTVNNSDGSYQQSWTQSNGSHGSTSFMASTGEVIGSNATAGAGYSYTYDNTKLDGGVTKSKVTYTYTDGSTYSTDTVSNPDGSYQQSWTQSNGSHGSTNYNALTGEAIGSNATAGAGYSYAYDNTKLAGGSTESTITYTYADGSTYATDTVNNPDGSYQQSWSQSNGSHGSTNYNALTGEVIGSNSTAGAGYSYTYDNTKLAGGSTESQITYTYADGSTYATDTVNNPDGSYQQSWTQSNGSHGSTRYNAITGEVIGSNSTAGAGYSYTYDNTKLAGGSTGSQITYTYADGSTYVTDTVNNPDGSYFQSWAKSDGTAGSVAVNSSGAAIGASSVAADGRQIVNAGGNHLLIGSAANDSMIGQAGNDLLIGGAGNDTLTTGIGTNVIAFDQGDGQDIINAVFGQNNTVSLGGHFAYTDLALQKNGDDLVLDIGAADSLTFKGWYAGNSNIVNLQVIAAAMSDFNPGSTDILRNSKVEMFDFQRIVSAFDQAQAASPSANPWGLANALLDAHLSSSDSTALGGDLANVYGIRGSLSGLGIAAAEEQLSSSQFAAAPQVLNPWPTLNTGTARIR